MLNVNFYFIEKLNKELSELSGSTSIQYQPLMIFILYGRE